MLWGYEPYKTDYDINKVINMSNEYSGNIRKTVILLLVLISYNKKLNH